MGKITVKHYLNKQLKPKKVGSNLYYPLYVQVIANRTNYRFKSNLDYNDGYFKESDLTVDIIKSMIQNVNKLYEKIFSYFIEVGKPELLTNDFIKTNSEYLWDALTRNFGLLFQRESEQLKGYCPDTLVDKYFDEINELLIFCESDVDSKFSKKYDLCKIGITSIYSSFHNDTLISDDLASVTVFDFLYGDGYNKVLQVLRTFISFSSHNEDEEYSSVIEALKELILHK